MWIRRLNNASRLILLGSSLVAAASCSDDSENGTAPSASTDAGDSGSDLDGSVQLSDATAESIPVLDASVDKDASPEDVTLADIASEEASPQDSALPECQSNTDCAAPKSVCDTVKGQCVECLVLSDCASKPGTVCSKGECECPAPAESWCAPSSCVDLQTSSENCGACGHLCYGACGAGKCADPWEPTPEAQAPEGRAAHVAVWTGTRMVVWGGAHGSCTGCELDSGGVFDPVSLAWTATSKVAAPSPRKSATAVWTGTEMLVWGGLGGGSALNTGARFDPTTNKWIAMSVTDAPGPRYAHTAVWTGNEMIVWGGTDGTDSLGSGGRYDPKTDKWTPLGSPGGGRRYHSAVWTGSEMWVYGGYGSTGGGIPDYLPQPGSAGGLKYSPTGGTWTELLSVSQPSSRAWHTATMAGSQMLVWGGYGGASVLGTGAVFTGTGWIATEAAGPSPRSHHTAVSLGSPDRILIWGGQDASGQLNTGASWDPAASSWSALPTGPAARAEHTAVSTGTRMIIWGGRNGATHLSSGAIYTP